MHQAHSAVRAANVAPVSNPGDRGGYGGGYSRSEGQIRGGIQPFVIAPGHADQVEQLGHGPGADGYIRDHGVKWVAQPDAVEKVFDDVAGVTTFAECVVYDRLYSISQLIYPFLL